jgi:GxxExxY protein
VSKPLQGGVAMRRDFRQFEAEEFTTENTVSTEGNAEKDPFTGRVIACAIEVHRVLGPGLLEGTYQQCLAHELHLNGIAFKLEHPMPVPYKGIHLDCGYRIDLLVEGRLILELKSVEEISGIHKAQLLTYMKLSEIATGLLINFNVRRLVDGIKRFKL